LAYEFRVDFKGWIKEHFKTLGMAKEIRNYIQKRGVYVQREYRTYIENLEEVITRKEDNPWTEQEIAIAAANMGIEWHPRTVIAQYINKQRLSPITTPVTTNTPISNERPTTLPATTTAPTMQGNAAPFTPQALLPTRVTAEVGSTQRLNAPVRDGQG
jgi:hypothetical protein